MFATSRQFVNATPNPSKRTARAFDRQVIFPHEILSRAAIAVRLFGSLALLPLVIAQGNRTRRRVPCLPPATPPYHGSVPGSGKPIRLLAFGEFDGLWRRARERRRVGRCHNSAGADAHDRSPDRMARRGAFRGNRQGCKEAVAAARRAGANRLLIVAFGVNDATAYRSPATFAEELAELVTALRSRCRRRGRGGRWCCAAQPLSRPAMAASQCPGLAFSRAASGSRSFEWTTAACRRGAVYNPVRA